MIEDTKTTQIDTRELRFQEDSDAEDIEAANDVQYEDQPETILDFYKTVDGNVHRKRDSVREKVIYSRVPVPEMLIPQK